MNQLYISHFSKKISKKKAVVAAERLAEIAPASKISISAERVGKQNIRALFSSCDILLDCTDNFATRKIIENYCSRTKKPWIYASATNMEAMACLANGGEKILPKKEPERKPPRTLNTTCSIAAALQVRLLYGWVQKEKLSGKIYYFDLRSMQFATGPIKQ